MSACRASFFIFLSASSLRIVYAAADSNAWLLSTFPPSRQTKFRRYPSRCPPAHQDYTGEPKGQEPGNRSIAKAGNVLGAGRGRVYRLEVDTIINSGIRRCFRATRRCGSGQEGIVQGARYRREEGRINFVATSGAAPTTRSLG